MRRWRFDWQKLRCTFRLYHQWDRPVIEPGSIIQVCQRCGKRVERHWSNGQLVECDGEIR